MENKDLLITTNSSMDVVARNKNGLLFEVDNHIKYNKDHINVIYINGSQLAHYDAQGRSIFSPISNNVNYGHVGDFYNEDIKPYVFKYIVDKDSDGVEEFSKSLIEILKGIDTNQNIVIGKSYGGTIGSFSAHSDLIKEVLAINPSICGSPLADLDLIMRTRKNISDYITYIGCKRVLEPGRRFTLENTNGVDIDYSDKIHIYGGTIEGLRPHTIMEIIHTIGYDKIMRLTGQKSDGIAVWDQEYYDSKGFDTIIMDRPYHSHSELSSYMKVPFQRVKQYVKEKK